jgi:hypothetical protein
MNIGTSCGAIPAKVSERLRTKVIAGFAKLVEEVNQYAAEIYSPTEAATALGLCLTVPSIVSTRPKVATNSPVHCPGPILER